MYFQSAPVVVSLRQRIAAQRPDGAAYQDVGTESVLQGRAEYVPAPVEQVRRGVEQGFAGFEASSRMVPRSVILCVPRTLSTSCDQAVWNVDHAADASVSPDMVWLKIDRFG